MNDILLKIMTAVAASKYKLEDVLEWVYDAQKRAAATSATSAASITDDAVPVPKNANSDWEGVPEEKDKGPGEVIATPEMWAFLDKFRDANNLTITEIAESGIYKFTFAQEVIYLFIYLLIYSSIN